MRSYLDSVAMALPALHREGDRMPRRLRPRATRATFVPQREASVLRGLARVA
ncbi:MAG: hypothetical protein QM611_02195 [Microbacterium sp.]|uniref:hypothetical protein n=1 Tax=Microbacterium sp. TaxID=51671 RepID=UPI0039E4A3E4